MAVHAVPQAGVWRRRAGVGVLSLWLLVSVARLSVLLDSPGEPIGAGVEPFLPFARETLPLDARYLFVDPTQYGGDPGLGPRLRYELLPRYFENVDALASLEEVRAVMERANLQYVVVPARQHFPRGHWLRSDQPGFERIRLDSEREILRVRSDR